jgi:hypothetical protein
VHTRTLGQGLRVSAIGLGAMGMSQPPVEHVPGLARARAATPGQVALALGLVGP